MKSKLLATGYTPHFSGHETFPLRQMWLKKAFEQRTSDGLIPKSTFTDESAIADFGVGKNMVSAIRHWALACDVLRDTSPTAYSISPIANAIFNDAGLDPYSENLSTSWYVHWWLAGKGHRATTWYWLFNHVTAPLFSKDDLEQPLSEFANKLDPKRKLSTSTLSRDIETCIRGYAPRSLTGAAEDLAEPMLAELGLISEERRGHFSFSRGPKTTLENGMFAYALLDFWDTSNSGLSALAFETIAFDEGSPGRVFKLDDDSVAERLLNLEELTEGVLAWTDTGGLKQVHRKQNATDDLKMRMIAKAYE
jgi:hypothetical protein